LPRVPFIFEFSSQYILSGSFFTHATCFIFEGSIGFFYGVVTKNLIEAEVAKKGSLIAGSNGIK
jgi:hypothetical protein